MFQFVEESEVWLHCDIQACDSRRFQCDTTCENRKRREIIEEEVFKLHRNRQKISRTFSLLFDHWQLLKTKWMLASVNGRASHLRVDVL